MKVLRLIALLSSVVMATGCATIAGDTQYPVNISSTPSGASFEIRNQVGQLITNGKTPAQVVLKSSAGYFKGERYQITFKTADTYQGKGKKRIKVAGVTKTIVLEAIVDEGLYIGGNILLGGLPGWLVIDPLSGAMWKLPESVHADLTNGAETGLKIISIDTLTAEQRSKLEPINL